MDLLRLWSVTGQELWKRYAYGALVFVTQMIADERTSLGYPEYFHGYQPEQYDNTEWDYIWTGFKTKGDYRNPICWVSALTLGGVLDILDEFPELLGELERLPPLDHKKSTKQRIAEFVRAIGVRLNLFT